MVETQKLKQTTGGQEKKMTIWKRFYSGRRRVFIDLLLEGWAKWTFWGNLGDLLVMLTGGVINFGLSSVVRELVINLANIFLNIFLSIQIIVPILIFLFYFIKNIVYLSSNKKVESKINKDDKKYEKQLFNIYKYGFFSRYGIKFIWNNCRGRLFNFAITSLFLALINLPGTWFIVYCIFVIWSSIGIIKDIIVTRYYYCSYVEQRKSIEMTRIKSIKENAVDRQQTNDANNSEVTLEK